MKYQVFENQESCSDIAKRCQFDPSWHQDTFDDQQKAEFYASAWACGRKNGPLRSMWEALAHLPFRMSVPGTKYINGCMMTIKEDAAHA